MLIDHRSLQFFTISPVNNNNKNNNIGLGISSKGFM